MKLSHGNYRYACDQAFQVNISNPTLFWNPTKGFYVSPSRDLVPNSDLDLGLAFYNANNGARSFCGSRREYQPIARGIRAFYKTPTERRDGSLSHYVHNAERDADYDEERRRG